MAPHSVGLPRAGPARRDLVGLSGQARASSPPDPDSRARHLVHSAVLLLPTGTPERGTPNQDGVGKVHDGRARILTPADSTGTGKGTSGSSQGSSPQRLTAWAQAHRRAAGYSPDAVSIPARQRLVKEM